jgi:hypothetical protein
MIEYKELYESLCKAVAVLEEENKKMMRAISLYEQKERQWEGEKVKQQSILQTMLDQKNKEHNEILEENVKLREQLRQARSM